MSAEASKQTIMSTFLPLRSSGLYDFGVSIFPFGLILESEDRSQEAEKVSGPRDVRKRGIFEA